MPLSDRQLMTELSHGSESAFRQIFMTYYSPLCEYSSQFVDDHDAEELVQDLMTHLWENREYIALEGSLKSYLFVAVRNRSINAVNKKKYNRDTHGMIYDKLKGSVHDPDNYMLDELAESIGKAIAQLPENYRKVFSMSRFGDYSNKAIAEELGVSVKTVEYYITQSLKILRVKLKDYLYILPFWL